MKTITFDSYGPPDVLQIIDLPDPQAGPGQVRVSIKAAGVQPVDCYVRSGKFGDDSNSNPENTPQILGNEFAGIMDQVGSEVSKYSVGDEVLGWKTRTCYAEYVIATPDQIVRKPQSMSWEIAAGLSGAGQAAHTAVEAIRVRDGDTVLIHAAAGAVGTVAVQLCRIHGASVIGTASKTNHDYLRSLGATPVTYGDGLADRVRTVASDDIDAAIDAAGRGALEASVELIKDRNRIITLIYFEKAPALGVRSIRSKRSIKRLSELTKLFAAGKLHIHIRKTYPFDHVVDAHRQVETGHGRGKVVLTCD